MNIKAGLIGLISIILAVNLSAAAEKSGTHSALPELIVFYAPSCQRCMEIKATLMPLIEKEFSGRLKVEYRDTSDIENYKLMLSLKEAYNSEVKISLPVFYFQGNFLNGQEQGLPEKLRAMITKYSPSSGKIALSRIDLVAYFKGFSPLAIISAGLADGINPCAFTVIVFFISFLALQGYRRRELTAIGLAFILAVFLTYCLIGLGLFGFLYQLRGFWLVTKIVNISIGTLSLGLGGAALYDFFKFRQTRRTEGLILQLPPSIKNRIHRLIGMHYRGAAKGNILKLVFSALVTGFLVSLLEAVCTGQLYLPTIAFVLKTSALKLEAAGYLLLYNLMFILPLVGVFFFALFGVTSEEFSRFLKRHLAAIKMLMAAIFFGLGIFLIWKG